MPFFPTAGYTAVTVTSHVLMCLFIEVCAWAQTSLSRTPTKYRWHMPTLFVHKYLGSGAGVQAPSARPVLVCLVLHQQLRSSAVSYCNPIGK